MLKKYVLASSIVGASLLLAGCSPSSPTSSTPAASPATPASVGEVTATEAAENNQLVVSNQSNGTSITIDSVTLEQQGFVMLLKTNADGDPTEMVGVSDAFTGTKTQIPIELMESFKVGSKLYAMLHIDGNNNGKFEWPGPDEPLYDENEEAIMKEFTLD